MSQEYTDQCSCATYREVDQNLDKMRITNAAIHESMAKFDRSER